MKCAARNRRLQSAVLLVACFQAIACSGSGKAKIENIRERRELTSYHLKSMTGVRDGDILQARVILEAGSSALAMDMRFRIGVPTRLERGRYRWRLENQFLEGSITQRSVTFLGGQSGRPSLGGAFELLSADGVPLYKVTVPTRELETLR